MDEGKLILVSGDFVLDHHIYEGNRHQYGDQRHRGVQEVEELGGAALVHYLLEELGGGIVSRLGVKVDENRVPRLPAGKRVPAERSAYAVWKPFGPEGEKSPERKVWRTEDAMGFGNLPDEPEAFHWPVADDLPQQPEVVVLSDGGMDFRREPDLWPCDDILAQARWIVLKTSGPFGEGKIWKHLTKPNCRSKLVVIASCAELRKSSAQISTGISWDATVESVLAALAPGGELAELAQCRHLLVSFGTEGGLWLDFGQQAAGVQSHLVYDADAVEDDQRTTGNGRAFGSLSCLAAAVAWHLARSEAAPDLEAALEGGLSAMCNLLEYGHGPAATKGDGYPAGRLAKVIREATCRYARAVFPAIHCSVSAACPAGQPPAVVANCWSLVHEALRQQGQACPEPAWALATLVAQRGPIALGSLPHLSIGKLMSADRREIEAMRVLRRLILDYRNRDPKECKKPLAIGVFGPPGAGKSFAVQQIAQTLVGKEEWMEFNLSQFKEGTEDLIGAFHQIRDRVLRGQTPVAFFDEFDSRQYGWLQYLLAPMQDGAFQEGQITHPIGKCIFIFAGGTSETFDSFGPPKGDLDAGAKFQMAKGSDFKSRLDGFLDIFGPNRREILRLGKDDKAYDRVPDQCDIFFPIRRALLMRAELRCESTARLEIDAGLLRALLRMDKYVHGARSMSKIIECLKPEYPGFIHRSLLPPRQQLELHVKDVEQFMKECRHTDSGTAALAEWTQEFRETVAFAIHEAWRQLGLSEARPASDPFDQLSEFLKESNRAAADRMIRALAFVGMTLQPGTNTDAERVNIRRKLEYNLELLAEFEHDGWMEWHLDQGWQQGPQKDPATKTHPCLKPYVSLSDEERNKDRNTIRHYPGFANAGDMKIVAMAP